MEIIGINKLKKVIKNSPQVFFETDVFDNGKFQKIVDVNENGIVTDKGEIEWEKINDRHSWAENGIPIAVNGVWKERNIINFKLTDEERAKKPYDFHLEKQADLEDEFKDFEDSLQENKKTKNMKITLSEIRHIIKEKVGRYKKIQLLEAKKASIEKELDEFLKESINMSLTNKKGMNARPNTPAFNSEKDTEEGIEMSLTNIKGINAKPSAPYFNSEEEMVDEVNFLKRGINTVGKALSIGDRATDSDSVFNKSLGKLNSKNIKYVTDYIQGKNTAFGSPTRENITRELKEIASDIKSILDKGNKNTLLQNSYDALNNIVSNPKTYIPNFVQGEKNQYEFIIDTLKKLHDLTYNEGN